MLSDKAPAFPRIIVVALLPYPSLVIRLSNPFDNTLPRLECIWSPRSCTSVLRRPRLLTRRFGLLELSLLLVVVEMQCAHSERIPCYEVTFCSHQVVVEHRRDFVRLNQCTSESGEDNDFVEVVVQLDIARFNWVAQWAKRWTGVG